MFSSTVLKTTKKHSVSPVVKNAGYPNKDGSELRLTYHGTMVQCIHTSRVVLTIFTPPPQAALADRSMIKTLTEFLNMIWTNSDFTYSRPGAFLFATQYAYVLKWQSAISYTYVYTDQVLCWHKQLLTVCVTTTIQFQYLPSPVSATENTNRTLYMGLKHVSILVHQFLQTASCISSFVLRVSRIRISAVSQEAVN